ncbi:MAG: DUF4340 domain-containing protein [Deltaproteobacteria bacterium]|nr:DUF4340 domain-containing protein [Deltaproteobacteria bacterium]
MRFFKKTVFWVIMLAIVGGSFYLLDKKTEEKKAEAEEKARLLPYTEDDISSFTLKRKDGTITVEREGDGWKIASPLFAAGDKKNIDKLVQNLIRAKVDGVLFEDPPQGKLKEVGLEEPYLTLELKGSAAVLKAIDFGDYGPTQNVAFARIVGEKRILRIHSDVRADADKKVYDLRDKTISPFNPTNVKSFDIRWKEGERIVVNHPGEGVWDVEGLGEGKTDFLKVMEFLIKLKKSEIKDFTDETPESLKPFGLDEPRVRVSFIDEKGARHTLLLGSRDKQKRGVFAQRGGEKNVFLVEEELMDTVPRSISDLEEKPKKQGPAANPG